MLTVHIIPFHVCFQSFALLQLRATRAVSGHSVPILSCVALGAAAIIRFFGPKSIGGAGDITAKTNAEVARTGLSADDIGPKVFISYHASRRTNVIQRYTTIRKGN